ncbi:MULTISPECIES: histidine phosphatase family protein [Bradyrhizobium]|uniref:histidine phosphatase family protein n=1 Tax=Bradyrhizobium TaxID=374 RepID=UPI00041AF92F|nr:MULTISPECIES: histidine phosphatase family protein [Bradyrhizobium]KIU52928.1 phosphoglycerate mutase [Bradyrhizobium elkanii]MBK5656061.1 histidine phosphatase family protein [Rhizobium sp.]OCX30420.1 phosphoglycerate mutase [Bradyrhizobium sp. UASWS1016]
MAFPSRSFLCLRHGTTDWNREGRFQGLTDNALNADGIAEAHAAARRLAGVAVAAIVASPLRRAVQTAEVVAATLSKDISIDAGIIECDFGSLEGQSIREAMQQHGITAMEDITTILPADGEPWPAVSERALRCVAAWQQRHPRADILFVCHDGVMQAMAEVLCGGFFENHHETPFRYARNGNGWKLEQIG